jgi:hypothetical protein
MLTKCNSKKQRIINGMRQSSEDQKSYFANEDELNRLIALLDNSSDLEAEHIGFTGKKSGSFLIFKRLSLMASDTTLIRLTHHKNPKIRVYSMWALTNNNKSLALQQLKQLIDDKETVYYTSGCTTMPLQVCYLAASRFDSTEVEINPNTKKHYLDYDIKIK